ncbi:UNVERIFIED_CONTAM: hypothetical protein Slati_2158300 [Sesamum latifolium]|uniref:Uncharacterized protein n=1 Tax=Sesamum latifolium TaxID=2727402 RepID=A0AAW2WWN2_9LAMI
MQVDLTKCDFFVHIHNLPLNMMNVEVATLIGNRIGIFRDTETDDTGCSWGATMRIKVALDVNIPLKRVLKIRSPVGDELLLCFTYERLPNFAISVGDLIISIKGETEDAASSLPVIETPGVHPDNNVVGTGKKHDTAEQELIKQDKGKGLVMEQDNMECTPGGEQRAEGDLVDGTAAVSNLVNIPLQFTVQSRFLQRGGGRWGRQSGGRPRGRPQKRFRGWAPLGQFRLYRSSLGSTGPAWFLSPRPSAKLGDVRG